MTVVDTAPPTVPADPPPAAPPVELEKPSAAPVRGRIGVLLVNLGSPDAPDAASVRRYLRQFLSDRRVIEEQGFVWKLVFKGVILPLRPRFKAHAYAKIWDKERNEAPLKTISRAQSERLAAAFQAYGDKIVVDWAMRYGKPTIAARFDGLIAAGCDRILVVPLYPQYCAATTATVADEVFKLMLRKRAQPAVRIAGAYFDDPTYIDALAATLKEATARMPVEPEVILASYHGIPKSYSDAGDPYAAQCAETTRLLRARLGYDEKKLVMTFQSRFGRAEWLTPATDKTIKALARGGVKSMAVIMPGFAADCLETLEEIAIENARIFHKNGGVNFLAVPCLNDSEPGMAVLSQLVAREIAGWV
jgi:ferrochelatase